MSDMNDADRVQRYREHAAKVREIARDVASVKTRTMLEGMAREWEQMAESAERQFLIAIPEKRNGAKKSTAV